jgi:hypothetical protein
MAQEHARKALTRSAAAIAADDLYESAGAEGKDGFGFGGASAEPSAEQLHAAALATHVAQEQVLTQTALMAKVRTPRGVAIGLCAVESQTRTHSQHTSH